VGTARVRGMESLSHDEFEAILDEALGLLPAGVTEQLDNVALFVEDRPEDGDRHLLGLYEGTPIGERGISGLEMPDNIFIYRDNLIDFAEDVDHLREEIVITIVHEIAHFYGIDDERLHELGWG
jgi:predicted Zn-dependent protease with MMP-like domain